MTGPSSHPAVIEAASRGAREVGAGSAASRLITGSLGIHHGLERDLATFKRTAGTLLFSSGHAAAVGTIPALVGPGDFVLLDRLAHACLVDGARLSGARLRVWRHNNVEDLGRLLRWAEVQRRSARNRRALGIGRSRAGPGARSATESVFSMDGDVAPLREIVACRDREAPWAWLMVDEAHATGVLGSAGQGLDRGRGSGGRRGR